MRVRQVGRHRVGVRAGVRSMSARVAEVGLQLRAPRSHRMRLEHEVPRGLGRLVRQWQVDDQGADVLRFGALVPGDDAAEREQVLAAPRMPVRQRVWDPREHRMRRRHLVGRIVQVRERSGVPDDGARRWLEVHGDSRISDVRVEERVRGRRLRTMWLDPRCRHLDDLPPAVSRERLPDDTHRGIVVHEGRSLLHLPARWQLHARLLVLERRVGLHAASVQHRQVTMPAATTGARRTQHRRRFAFSMTALFTPIRLHRAPCADVVEDDRDSRRSLLSDRPIRQTMGRSREGRRDRRPFMKLFGLAMIGAGLACLSTPRSAHGATQTKPSDETSGLAVGVGFGYKTSGLGLVASFYGQLGRLFRLVPYAGAGIFPETELKPLGYAFGMMAIIGEGRHRFVIDIGYGLAGVATLQSLPPASR